MRQTSSERRWRLCEEPPFCQRRIALETNSFPRSAVRRVDASGGNFLLLRLVDADAAIARLRAAGIAVRDMRAAPALADAVRATVGTARQNAALFDALAQSGQGA